MRWNLEELYAGGAASEELDSMLAAVEAGLQQVRPPAVNAEVFVQALDDLQHAGAQLSDAEMFSYCLNVEQPENPDVKELKGRIGGLKAKWNSRMVELEQWMTELSEAEWHAVLEAPTVAPIRYLLNDRKARLEQKMDAARELLVQDLATDGYHAWGEVYFQMLNAMRIPFSVNGEVKAYTRGQMWGFLVGPDPDVRSKAADAMEAALEQQAELIASTLNHLAGFRLNVYRHRGYTSVLQEAMAQNQMSEATLEAMWSAVDESTNRLTAFLKRKAELIGTGVVSHFDIFAPIGDLNVPVPYEEAQERIVTQFSRISKHMGEFAARAFQAGWIDAEERPGKSGGGVCIPFHLRGESRITLGYQNNALSLLTLAHELGHGYHNAAVHDLPHLAREYPMSVAETASTFGEMVVLDAAIADALNDEERLKLLGAKMQRIIPLILGVRGAFLFEVRFHEQRQNGPLSVAALCQLMADCQQEAFQGALDRTNPYQWASQGQIYATEVPFYSFQYTFGYLFSTGLYARALAEGERFADKYAALLRDTGRMSVEDLARTHLGVDLTAPSFWQDAMSLLVRDVELFLKLSAS
ncbi:M3 family oligoendopeptidase [Tumebacillus flagellatus]|uniref:Peptidase M3A/M3B catalytic domain-containing protein n=1 Tax=Tumebacillus flagellatus TaxID=1157490 RepID=A0A074M8H1_9BACL|nr:M3 family oligoendopeptidase [Tumebacillus flagellatus]KEO82282.1 hypothetical protein EL26_15985 [Tumebacillus flagellatus]